MEHNESSSLLRARLHSWRLRLLARDGIEGTLAAFAWTAGIFLALTWLDRWLLLPYPVRAAGFLAIAAAMLYGLWRAWVRPALYWTVPRVIAHVEAEQPGLAQYLLPAWELGADLPEHVSRELAALHKAETEKKLSRLKRTLVPLRRPAALPYAAAAAAFLALSLGGLGRSRLERVLAPWRRVPLEALLDIQPLGARIPWGQPVSLGARWRQPNAEAPRLFVRSPDGPWREQAWDETSVSTDSWRWTTPGLSEELDFRVAWRDQTSESYALVPVPFPQFSEVRYKLTPPISGAGAAQEVPGGGDIEALLGTAVEILGRTPDAVGKAALKVKGRAPIPFEKTPEGDYRASFNVTGDGSFRWEITGEGGIADPQPADHKITAVTDQPPEITLLSPTFELEIGPKELLPVDFSASDDFGLTGLWLVSRARLGGLDSGERTTVLPGLPAGAKDYNGEYRWDLSDFLPGSRVEFYLKAADNARPPHSARSAVGVLHIVDFDAIHKDADAKRAALVASLEQLQKSGEEAAKELRDADKDPAKADAAREKEAALQNDWKQEQEAQQQTQDALAKDPYRNPGAQQSDQDALDQLSQAAQSLLSQSSRASAQKDMQRAAQAHEDLAQEASDALKRLKQNEQLQNMEDFAEKSKRMDQAGSDLQHKLEDMQKKNKADDKDWKEVQKALQDLQQQMAELAKQVEQFSKQPDNQVSSKDQVKSLDMDQAARQSDALQQALDRHDMKAALKAAQDLSRQLAQMRKTLERARSEAGPSQPPSKEMEQLMKDWEAAAKAQEKRVAAARAFADQRQQDELKAQRDMLAELAKRQRAVNAKAAGLPQPLAPAALADMAAALREFETRHIENAPAELDRTVSRFKFLAASLPDEAILIDPLRAEEEDILALLKRGAQAPPPSQETQDAMKQEAEQEEAVNKQVEGLKNEAKSAREQGAALPRAASQALKGASEETKSAGQSEGEGDAEGGLSHARKALDDLEKGMQSAQQGLQKQLSMEGQMSSPAPGGMRTMSQGQRGQGGQSGTDVEPVKLPSSADYQPPQEIRRQVIESLQEKMPASQQPAIKDYLKNVVE